MRSEKLRRWVSVGSTTGLPAASQMLVLSRVTAANESWISCSVSVSRKSVSDRRGIAGADSASPAAEDGPTSPGWSVGETVVSA